MRIEDFVNKFVSLKHQGNVSDDFTCALLEQAIHPELLREVLLTNYDISDWDDFSQCVLCWRNTCIAQGNACIQLTCCCVVVLVVTN